MIILNLYENILLDLNMNAYGGEYKTFISSIKIFKINAKLNLSIMH